MTEPTIHDRQVRTSAGVSFEDLGERDLKGVSEPVRVRAVV